ncbi:MAG: hypothetical protein KME17_23885 [Cyanosarcina radialis HA8281-LM2]|jgi:hypothetical protein|nr:hypothetical protein [Cyanosarcina radialis HA8281-LM2]
MLKAVRKFLKDRSPDWLNVEIDGDLFKNLLSHRVSSQPLSTTPIQNPKSKIQNRSNPKFPHWRRITQVYQLLDRAHESGIVSYTALTDYVRSATGQGCSRKLISKWKKERGWR